MVVLFIAFFIWLLVGIKLDTFKVADYNIDGLYIKLDKKLILEADNVIIPKRKEEPSFDSVDKTFDRIRYLFTFFESIDLKNIAFENNSLSIQYRHEYLRLTSKDYEIVGTVRREGEMIQATVPLLELKEHNLTIDGLFTYDLHDNILVSEGNFVLNDIVGVFSAIKANSEIKFGLKSSTFTDIKPIIDKFNLHETVRSWVVDRVEAEHYQLLSLSGKGYLKDKKFKMDLDTLEGKALFSGVKIHFKEGLAPVLAPSFILTYENDGLYFDLKSPTYEDRSLEGSKVSIVNLADSNTTLKLDIAVESPFDRTMQKLLHAYTLEIPVIQKNGKVHALFHADIALKKKKNDFVTDVDFSQGDVWIKNVKLPIVNGKLHYEKGFIFLEDIYLKDSFYEGRMNGKIDLQKKKADLLFDAKKIELGDKNENFFVLKDQKLPFVLKFKDNIDVVIPKLYARLTNDHNETHIYLTDLNKIKPYLLDPGPIEQGGNVEIKTKDFKAYTFHGVMKWASCFLYDKDNECQTRVPFQGKVTAKGVDFYAFDKRVYYNKFDSRIKITDLNIDLEEFLKASNKRTKRAEKTKDGSKQNKSLIILGKKSHFRYGEYTLVSDSYDIEVKPNGNIKAIGSSSGDIIKFSKNRDILSIQALRIKDNVLHPLIDFKGLQNGRYTLKLSGNPEKTMNGEIIVEGGVMKDFKAYNNTLAFINTLPALAALQNPGYSVEGFTIEEGIAEYRMIKQDKIVFDSIYIKGKSATIAGTGEIDLKQKTIDLNLAIQSARKLGKMVGSLPLVGYILMGEDKSMTFGMKITGMLDDPKVDTSAGGDILSLPLKILNRALKSTKHIIKE